MLQPVFRFMFDLMRRVRSAICKEKLHRHQQSACECQLPFHAVVDLTVSSARAPGAELHSSLTGRTAAAPMAQSIRMFADCPQCPRHITPCAEHGCRRDRASGAAAVRPAGRCVWQQGRRSGGSGGSGRPWRSVAGRARPVGQTGDRRAVAPRHAGESRNKYAMSSVYDKKTASSSDDSFAGRSGNRCAGWLHCVDGCMPASDGSNSNGLRPDSVVQARLRRLGRGVTAVSTTLLDAWDPVSCRRLRGRRTSHRWSTSPTRARIFFAKCNRCADKQDRAVVSLSNGSTVQYRRLAAASALCSTESGSHLHISQYEKLPDTQLLHSAGVARQAFRSGRQGGERPCGRRQWAAACQAVRHAPAGGRGSNRFAHARRLKWRPVPQAPCSTDSHLHLAVLAAISPAHALRSPTWLSSLL